MLLCPELEIRYLEINARRDETPKYRDNTKKIHILKKLSINNTTVYKIMLLNARKIKFNASPHS